MILVYTSVNNEIKSFLITSSGGDVASGDPGGVFVVSACRDAVHVFVRSARVVTTVWRLQSE